MMFYCFLFVRLNYLLQYIIVLFFYFFLTCRFYFVFVVNFIVKKKSKNCTLIRNQVFF